MDNYYLYWGPKTRYDYLTGYDGPPWDIKEFSMLADPAAPYCSLDPEKGMKDFEEWLNDPQAGFVKKNRNGDIWV